MKIREHTGFGMVAVFYSFLVSIAVVSAAEETDSVQARAAMSKRLEPLRNLSVEFETTEEFTPPSDVIAATPNVQMKGQAIIFVLSGARTNTGRFRFLDGRAYYERRAKESTSTEEESAQQAGQPANLGTFRWEIQSFSEGRSESVWRQWHESRDLGKISLDATLPNDRVVDLALGLRALDENTWLNSDAWNGFDVQVSDRQVAVSRRTEHVDPAHTRLDVWTFDPSVGYALVKYEVFRDGKLTDELTASDFRSVEDVVLPFEIQHRSFVHRSNQESHVTATTRVQVVQYTLNDPTNTPGSFHLTFPAKAVVLDEQRDRQINVGDTPRTLSDAESAGRLRGEGLQTRRGSLWWFGVNAILVLIAVVTLIALRRKKRT